MKLFICTTIFYVLYFGLPGREVTILNFLKYLEQEEVSAKLFDSKYFFSKKFKNSDNEARIFNLLVMSKIKDELKNSSIEVISYSEAKKRDIDVFEIASNVKNIYVILFKGHEDDILGLSYCLMNGNFIESLCLQAKGSSVVDWI